MKSARILQAAWRGRAGMGIHDVVKTYVDFRDMQGLTLPFGLKVSVNGKPVADPAVTVEWVKVNEPVKAEMPDTGP